MRRTQGAGIGRGEHQKQGRGGQQDEEAGTGERGAASILYSDVEPSAGSMMYVLSCMHGYMYAQRDVARCERRDEERGE